MSPGDDPHKFPFGDSDEGFVGGFDSDDGQPISGLDSEMGHPISGLDSDEGFMVGLDSEDLDVIEDSAESSPPLPDLSSARVLPQRPPVHNDTRSQGTLPPNYPTRPQAQRGEGTLPPNYPTRPQPQRGEGTLPPNYPTRPQAQRGEGTLPPTYPTRPQAQRGEGTLPPNYPTRPQAQRGEGTLPPNYPTRPQAQRGEGTLPPNYPTRPQAQGEPTRAPTYPSADATAPPLYPVSPFDSEPDGLGDETAGPGYGAAAGDNDPTVAPGYQRRLTREEKATAPPAYLSRQAERTELDHGGDAADTVLNDEDSQVGKVVDRSAAETLLNESEAGQTVLDAGDAARTALDYGGSDAGGVDRGAATDLDIEVPIIDPGDSDLGAVFSPPTGGPPQRDPFASKSSGTVSGWADPALPYQPAMRRPGSQTGSRASQIEQRLLQTMELDPDEVTGRDAWDDYVLQALESHGETPIIMPASDVGPIFGTDSDSMLGEIFMPNDAGPLAPTAPALPKVGPEFSGEQYVAERATAMDRLGGLWTGDALWVLLSLAGVLLGPILIAIGWEYYGLDHTLRPGHIWDKQLKPSGSMGLWFGICGSILFLLNLTYVLRRRFFLLAKWISLRLWLNLHFVFGLTGGSMILIHSSLQASNWVARVSSAAIAVALFSGVFGRYVLSHVPRREEGETSNRTELAVYLAQLRGDLRRKLGPFPKLRTVALKALAASAPSKPPGSRGGLGIIPALIMGDIKAFGRRRKFTNQLRKLLRSEAQGGDVELERLIEETLEMVRLHGRLGARLSQFESVQDLMDSWRALHMILALIMVVTMVLHVVIVLTYGNVL